ncbi:hypothetical protein BS47DRAFT_1342512 [Hydnum rufescens UP504]|uniref:CCHC-type domain-containing protein n=1 Tax=Hydnum rufescens UP504 TaxID=1448309 RepID=A0A9P6AZY0_9AGAM|nr:hypothetical protein BS47DRAFT_1342512 [Hydnum rufescens UP504]
MDEIPADAFTVFGAAGEGLCQMMEAQQRWYEQLEQQNLVLQNLVTRLQTDASSCETLMAEVGVITKAVVENLPAPVVEVPPAPATTPSISACPPKAADPETKILYALSYMQGGSAGDWASNYTCAILDGDSPFPGWETFCTHFEAAFELQLHTLKMTQGMTAEEYTMAFEAISGKTGFNDGALMDVYEHGLLHSLVKKIHLDTLPMSLQEWKDKATCIDKLWCHFNEQHSFSPTNPCQDNHPGTIQPFHPPTTTPQTLPTSFHPAAAVPSSSTYEPMDVDSNHCQNNPWQVTGLCWNCNKPGHIARDCPEPPCSHSMEEVVEKVRATLAPKSTEDGNEGVAKDF